MKKIFLVGLLALVLAIWGMGRAEATTYNLTDANSTAAINDASPFGMYSWRVDGVSMLYQQWFWYRVGNTTTAASIDTLGPPTSVATSNTLTLVYTSPGQFSVQVGWSLVGGTPGSHTSDISEQIRLNNISQTALDFHFFQYTDFDLGGLFGGFNDTVSIIAPNVAHQNNPNVAITETTVTTASRWEANLFPNTLNSLGTAGYNLSDATGPLTGDATWAFQWNRTLAPGGSFLISKDKHIDAVPEPATMLLLGSGLLGIGVYARRRFSKK